jgi:hypothetical protein
VSPAHPGSRLTWLITLGIFLLALLPRALAPLGGFVTVDEAMHWLGRVEAFAAAVAEARFADTVLSGHPGVTTMWLGWLGLMLERSLLEAGLLGPGFASHLAMLRLPLALVNALAVAVGYLLLRRVFGPAVALLAALFWALDPFVVAHARLLHVDGLLTSFATLSLLGLLAALADARAVGVRSRSATTNPPLVAAALAAEVDRRGRPDSMEPRLAYLVLAGVCAGLAFLTKVPSVFLIPASAAILALGAARQAWLGRWTLARAARHALVPLAVWSLSALVAAFVLWPALWVAPDAALARMLREALDNGDSPHGWGNFFWGQAIADPGPLFYLVALPFRLTPWASLGLLACALLAWAPRSLVRRHAWPAGALVLWLLFFTLPLLVAAKKFDRYLLPIAACLLLLSVATLLVLHPYYLSYYNPLLGGGPVAQRVLPVGWGEGMDQAAAWLNQQPDLADGAVASWFEFTLTPYAEGQVYSVGYFRRGRPGFNYLVLYADQVQRRNEPTVVDAFFGLRAPLHSVRLHGLDYAWIYQVPPPFEHSADARFGEGPRLTGYSLGTQQLAPGATLELRLGLWAEAAQPADLMVFAHLIGPDGRRYAQIDAPAGDARFAEQGWHPGRTILRALPLSLPPNAPAGLYQLAVGLYRLGDGARLPLTAGPAADPQLAGEHALLLASLHLP